MADNEEVNIDEGDQEEDPVEEKLILSQEVISKSLVQIDKATDRANSTLVRLEFPNRGLTTLEGDLSLFQDIKYVNLAGNELTSMEALNELQNLRMANFSKNNLTKFDSFGDLPNFQMLQVDNNQLVSFDDFNMPSLKYLSASNNKIVDLSQLQMASPPVIEMLNLSNNQIESLSSIDRLPALTDLSVSKNSIKSVDGLETLVNLRSLDLSNNQLESFEEVLKLAVLPNLRTLVTQGNSAVYEAFAEEPERLLLELVLAVPQLQSFDGQPITTDIRVQADRLRKAREAEVRAKKAAEEAEMEKARRLMQTDMKLDLAGIAPDGGVEGIDGNDFPNTGMSTNINEEDIEE
jgi:Leucine-rich repeat (LRR) protein